MLGTAVSLALIATPITAAIAGVTAALLFELRPQAGPAGRRGPREHRRRGDLRAAAQLDAAAEARARARGRVGPQRPRRRAARARADRVHQHARLRLRRRAAAARAPARHRARGRRGWSAGSASRRSAARGSRPPGLYPVASLAIAALAFGGADTLHGSGFLAVYLAGLALGSAAIPAQQTITAFHQGLAWVAQVGMFLTLGLLVFPHQLADICGRGHRAGARRRGDRAAAGGLPGHGCSPASASASGSCSAGPGCAARSRWCSRRSR